MPTLRAEIEVPGKARYTADPHDDGRCECVDRGRCIGFVDLVLFFRETVRPATNGPPGRFDCTNARIRFAGVVIPFEAMESLSGSTVAVGRRPAG